MPRLYRPHIPMRVQCLVAERQLLRQTGYYCINQFGVRLYQTDASFETRRDAALWHLSGGGAAELHLDHDPPLGARARRGEGKRTRYTPGANDPNFLIYREKHEHHIKTNVRGEHGQHPDRVLIKRERRRRQRKTKSGRVKPKATRFSSTRPKTRAGSKRLRGRVLPTRKLQGGGRWPAKGSRKIRSRP